MNPTWKIYRTTNYSMFKKLIGNRDIDQRHKIELIKSIKENGYVMNPILVNERMEVVDGQHRLAALEELGLPVYYYIVPGLTAKECGDLNRGQKNWKSIDYINKNAALGNINYRLLKNLFDAYPLLRMRDIIGLAWTPVAFGTTPKAIQTLKREYILTYQHYEWANDIASKYMTFYVLLKTMNTDKFVLGPAILFTLTIPEIDVKRLYNVLSTRRTIKTNGTIQSGVEEVDSLYNAKLRSGRVDILGAWKTKKHLKALEEEWKNAAEALPIALC